MQSVTLPAQVFAIKAQQCMDCGFLERCNDLRIKLVGCDVYRIEDLTASRVDDVPRRTPPKDFEDGNFVSR